MRRLLALLLLATFASAAQARPVEALDYQKRFDSSDLVVIATPTAKTTDTKETSNILNLYRQDAEGKQVPIPAVGVETPFAVSVVLKGDKNVTQLTLHHYRLSDEVPLMNVPMLFNVGEPDLASAADGKPRNSFLMFLMREPDGRYAPTAGQLDPAYEAIFPLPFEHR